MRIEGGKVDKPEAQSHVIPEVGKTSKSDISMERKSPHKYNIRSSTNRVNHVTTFKTAPNMFKIDAAEKITTHIGTDYLARTDPQKYTTKVELLSNHINCETTKNIRLQRTS